MNDVPAIIEQLCIKSIATHLRSFKDATTIFQQELSYFNMASCCSSQKGSLTILHMKRNLYTHNIHCSSTDKCNYVRIHASQQMHSLHSQLSGEKEKHQIQFTCHTPTLPVPLTEDNLFLSKYTIHLIAMYILQNHQ